MLPEPVINQTQNINVPFQAKVGLSISRTTGPRSYRGSYLLPGMLFAPIAASAARRAELKQENQKKKKL